MKQINSRSKIGEINNEIIRMNKEMTSINSDNSNYLSYGKKYVRKYKLDCEYLLN